MSVEEQWRSLEDMVEIACDTGVDALNGVAVALARMVQAEIIHTLVFEARQEPKTYATPDNLLWSADAPISTDGLRLCDMLVDVQQETSVDLKDTVILPNPHKQWKLARALQDIWSGRTNGAWQQDSNHNAFAWLPWPIVWVGNGNHSIAAGMIRGEGIILCRKTFDATDVLRSVRTDGRF